MKITPKVEIIFIAKFVRRFRETVFEQRGNPILRPRIYIYKIAKKILSNIASIAEVYRRLTANYDKSKTTIDGANFSDTSVKVFRKI